MGSPPSADPRVEAILRRGVAEIVVEAEFRKLLASGRPLRLKMGFDPSRPDIHLGHVVGLRKLRQLQDLGHQVVLIVGDWTARIGDPSGQSVTRPMLTEEEVRANAETYMKQFFKVVDREKTEVAWQSQWFNAFTLADVIRLASRFTVAQFLAREDFRKRYETGQPLGVHELLYPLLQAYDSIAVKADVEFGGTDQKFNLLVGRELQAMMGHTPQQCFLVPILVGTDGVQKMSKSLGNYIAIEDPPHEMFGKVMSIPDSLIMLYFELVTDVSDKGLAEFRSQLEERSVNPMVLKQRLAHEIVEQFYGHEAAKGAEEHFNKTFRQKEVPISSVRSFKVEVASYLSGQPPVKAATQFIDLTKVMVAAQLVGSRGEARRLMAQRAVELDGEIVENPLVDEKRMLDGSILKVGKLRFVKLIRDDVGKK
ncbi:MAG: tyrosine--tRNA ligase [Chloroflexi bacterium]|nr:tyrosine--tRNA ligase [Chloroflexota bacterium]